MTFDPSTCPECSEPPRGTLETIEACAEFIALPDGSFELSGNTEIFYDTSETKTLADGRVTLLCLSGHEFGAVQISHSSEKAT